MPSDVRDAMSKRANIDMGVGGHVYSSGIDAGVRVLLVRHGETIWNQENRWQGQADTPLSRTGYEQARQLARRFQNEGRRVQAIYTSDLRRARDTAAILGRALGVRPIEATAWREMDIGTWSGLTTAEVASRHAEEWARLRQGEDLPRGGGETFAQFQGRLVQSSQQFIRDHRSTQILVVTHGGAVRAFLLHCRGLNMNQFGQIEKIGNTGISEVTLSPSGQAKIHMINSTAHLNGAVLSGETVDA